MKIFLIHNRYLIPGGEDQVFRNERGLLESHGVDVRVYEQDNRNLEGILPWKQGVNTIWNQKEFSVLKSKIRAEKPDVVHVHNFFPIISPAVYYAAGELNIPVVQTLHNYRLACSNALFYRDGAICTDCLGKYFPYPGIVHACYRGNKLASTAVASMIFAHRLAGTWNRHVNRYIALTNFARELYLKTGLPPEKVAIKPNFVLNDPGMGAGKGDYLLFVGRLSPEKGIASLLEAWKRLDLPYQLLIAGDGPLAGLVETAAKTSKNLRWLGRLPVVDIIALMKDARCLINPSECFETFALSIIEAFSTGLPVLASRLGGPAELVEEGITGLLFSAGNATDLAEKISWVCRHPDEIWQMRQNARTQYEQHYSANKNFDILMNIYQAAIQDAAAQAAS